MPLRGSTVVRRQLGRRLRRLRDEAGKTEVDVEEARIASKAKLWRIETGKVSVKVGDVRGLCWLYGADAKTTDSLATLAVGTKEQGWWEDYVSVFPRWFSIYIGLESAADEIRVYDPELVHGLLQTPEYVRALRRTVKPDDTEDGIESQVKLRLERQQTVFARTPPLRLVAVLGAGVLSRAVGGAKVMAEQVSRLHELSRRDHIDIRVLPWTVGAHPAMHIGAFTILDFHNDADPAAVYLETHTGARYLEKRDELAEYRRIFERIYNQTIPIEQHLP